MKLLGVCLVISTLLLAGCGLKFTKPPIPEGCENSLILNNVPSVGLVDAGIKIAVVRVAKLGYKKEVTLAINGILSTLPEEGGVLIGTEFVSYAVANVESINKYADVELIIIMEPLGALNVPVPLDPCDIELIRQHLLDELKYLSFVKD